MPESIIGRILRLTGYGAYRWEFNEGASKLTLWVRANGPDRRFHACGGCGIGVKGVHDVRERPVRDLPWGTWIVVLIVEVHRVRCRRCGVKSEMLPFVQGKHPFTRRFVEAVGRDCEDAAVSRVATKWNLSPSTTRRIDKRYLQAWARHRRRRPLRQLGVDEIFWKKGACLTVVSDLGRGEPVWAAPERKTATLDMFFTEHLWPLQRRAIRVVCMDMWGPYITSVRRHAPQAAIVFDKFHVMQHVGAAVDETRRREFFRRGQQGRDLIRGKRWLFLTRWANLEPFQRRELETVFQLNRRLFKAHLIKEQIDHLWHFTYEGAARAFFYRWLLSIRWQRLPAFQKLARTLERHLDGILAYCRHKVPFGVVEAINANIRAIIRRGRGYRDHDYLILKVQRATARRARRRAA